MGAVQADAGGKQLAVWAGVGEIWDSGWEWGAECPLGGRVRGLLGPGGSGPRHAPFGASCHV